MKRNVMVGRVGLEPTCFCVSGLQPPAVAAVPPADEWSGWRDSNSRPSDPKSDALRKLSYPTTLSSTVRGGYHVARDRKSNLVKGDTMSLR